VSCSGRVAVGVLQRCCRKIFTYICICAWRKGGKDKEKKRAGASESAREGCVAGVLQSVLQWVLGWCCSAIFLWCCSEISLFAIVVCGSVCCIVCRVQCVQCVVGGERVEREKDE